VEIEAGKGGEDDNNQQEELPNKNIEEAPVVDAVELKVAGEIGGADAENEEGPVQVDAGLDAPKSEVIIDDEAAAEPQPDEPVLEQRRQSDAQIVDKELEVAALYDKV